MRLSLSKGNSRSSASKKKVREASEFSNDLLYEKALEFNTPISNALIKAIENKLEDVPVIQCEEQLEIERGIGFHDSLVELDDLLVIPYQHWMQLKRPLRERLLNTEVVKNPSQFITSRKKFLESFKSFYEGTEFSYTLYVYRVGEPSSKKYSAFITNTEGKDPIVDKLTDTQFKKLNDFLRPRTVEIHYVVRGKVGSKKPKEYFSERKSST